MLTGVRGIWLIGVERYMADMSEWYMLTGVRRIR